jgi:NADH-quinone oxidoreductase subunit K
MTVPLTHVLTLAGGLFFIGIWCAVTRRNLIMVMLGIEIMLNAAALAFVGASLRWQQMEGQAVALFVLAIAAAEVSVGLALIVCIYRRYRTLDPAKVQ